MIFYCLRLQNVKIWLLHFSADLDLDLLEYEGGHEWVFGRRAAAGHNIVGLARQCWPGTASVRVLPVPVDGLL
jgi:hypothetical protein